MYDKYSHFFETFDIEPDLLALPQNGILIDNNKKVTESLHGYLKRYRYRSNGMLRHSLATLKGE